MNMKPLWNKKDLEHPANNISVVSRKSIDFEKFVSSLETAIKDLESQNALHTEAAILSRLIYRMKTKFRNDKGLKNMEKVNRALLNYLEIHLLKEYKDLKNYVELNGNVVTLPTKQMVQYVLVRTQGFAKLMCRIESVSKCAAEFFMTRLTIGHAWTISVIAYAVISRVWYLSRYLLRRCCAWYNIIFWHVSQFKSVGPRWLPENYDLPSNLKTWLDLPWIDQPTDSVPLQDDGKGTIFGLIKAQIGDPGDLNFDDEDIDCLPGTKKDSIDNFQDTSRTEQEIQNPIQTPVKAEDLFSTEDIGMSIDRETFELKLNEEVPNTQEPIKRKANFKRNKDSRNKRKASVGEEVVLSVPKKRKKKKRNQHLGT